MDFYSFSSSVSFITRRGGLTGAYLVHLAGRVLVPRRVLHQRLHHLPPHTTPLTPPQSLPKESP